MANATATKPANILLSALSQQTTIPQPGEVLPAVQSVTPLKFRVMAGQHSGFDKDMQTRLWRTGEIAECYHKTTGKPYDLAKRFNQPDSVKFQLVPADTPSSKGLLLEQGNPVADPDEADTQEVPVAKTGHRLDGTDDMFDSMTLVELRKYAEENEIPIDGVKTQEATLEAIRQYENLSHPLNR